MQGLCARLQWMAQAQVQGEGSPSATDGAPESGDVQPVAGACAGTITSAPASASMGVDAGAIARTGTSASDKLTLYGR